MKSIASRLKNLEKALNQNRRDVLVVIPKPGETKSQAIARSRKEAGNVGGERLILVINTGRQEQAAPIKDDLDRQIQQEIEALKNEGWTERKIEEALSAKKAEKKG